MMATALSQALEAQESFLGTRLENLDSITERFMKFEKLASTAYADALVYDLTHERLKDQLISLLSDAGVPSSEYTKTLRTKDYSLCLRMAPSNIVDPDAVGAFRAALIREGIAKGVLTEVFVTKIRHGFTNSADAVLARLQLPDPILKLYKQCRPRTPILTVSPI